MDIGALLPAIRDARAELWLAVGRVAGLEPEGRLEVVPAGKQAPSRQGRRCPIRRREWRASKPICGRSATAISGPDDAPFNEHAISLQAGSGLGNVALAPWRSAMPGSRGSLPALKAALNFLNERSPPRVNLAIAGGDCRAASLPRAEPIAGRARCAQRRSAGASAGK